MHEDLTEMAFDRIAESRMESNQRIRARMIKSLGGNDGEAEATAKDPKLAYVLLAALKDSDTIDIKRLGLKQNQQEIDSRGRVLSFLENINTQVKGNPYYQPNSNVNTDELKGRPTTFYDKEDFVEGELDIETKLTNYQEFMTSRNAIPNSVSREPNDSTS